jgi:large subunit ribosomal protein L6
MSRIAKNPVPLPPGVGVSLESDCLTVKGSLGVLHLVIHPLVEVKINADTISVVSDRTNPIRNALAGTTRANIANTIHGVNKGYERKLVMIGVGYRAQSKGDTLSLSLGFSHPIDFPVPEGIKIETPTQTEILIKGCDKQQVGQVAANIRAYRPPEPYKGKGVRYSDEIIIRKEAKKK